MSKFQSVKVQEDIQSIWLKSIKGKYDRVKSYVKNTEHHKKEDVNQVHSEPYEYYVSVTDTSKFKFVINRWLWRVLYG
jgi:hypothetical protein